MIAGHTHSSFGIALHRRGRAQISPGNPAAAIGRESLKKTAFHRDMHREGKTS